MWFFQQLCELLCASAQNCTWHRQVVSKCLFKELIVSEYIGFAIYLCYFGNSTSGELIGFAIYLCYFGNSTSVFIFHLKSHPG